MGIRHPQLEVGRQPLRHHPDHCTSGETETHRRKRPIVTTGRLVQRGDLNQVASLGEAGMTVPTYRRQT